MKTCIENVGFIHHPETLEWSLVSTCRIALVRTGSEILRFRGFVLNENPDGSNSISVRITKA